MSTFDYTSMGFITFDALCRPVTNLPEGGGTFFVEDFALAVSGAAGSAAIVAAKNGLKTQAVGGVGEDDMGDWVLMKLKSFGIDTSLMARCAGVATSSSIVTTRPGGARPALHKLGATGAFYIDDDQVERVLDTKILHVGGVGLMDRMDEGRSAEIMAEARARGITTTLDVFASTPDDMPKLARLLPHADYFMPSEEEAMAVTGAPDPEAAANALLEAGGHAVVLTLGPEGALYLDLAGTRVYRQAFQIDVKCTCGCGDCFNAGFATGLILGEDMAGCIDLGQAASAQNATGLGSQAGNVDLATTRTFIEQTPRRPASALAEI